MTPFKNRVLRLLLLLLTAATVIAPARATAATSGTITGRVIKAPADTPLPHVKVTLMGANRDGSNPITHTVMTDRRGSYVFGHVTASNQRIYALDAHFDGGLFAGGAIQVPRNTSSRPVIQTGLRVWNTTTDPSAILISRDDLFVQQNHDGVGVIESITVENNTNAAYIGRGADVTAATSGTKGAFRRPVPSLGLPLPTGADRGGVSIVQSDIDLPQLLPTDFGVAATTAIPPGQTRITYSYRAQGLVGATDISRTELYPTVEVSIFAAPPLAIQSNRLSRADDVTVGKITYHRWSSTDPLAPGDELQVLAVARAGLAPGLVIGLLAAFALFALIGGLFFLHSRRREARGGAASPTTAREDVLIAIATLDGRYEAGEIAENEWSRQRAALKAEVERMP
ncbi:MAG: carboxypeptidase-like regulatory domain-containing protein [Actinomycetota bacterium]|nr:carboxypeptidase-like regulatory domain-containing protein [Actinomycetota bacterium]